MEKPFKTNKNLKILEVGAGEGEHIDFVTHDYLEYIALDLDAERLKNLEARKLKNVRTLTGDALKLDFEEESFDRVIATCLLAHVRDPEMALKEWRRVLKPGGSLTIYIPCEPGIVLKIFRKVFTKPKATRLGYLGYDLFIARDHINSTDRLCVFIAHIFSQDTFRLLFKPFWLKSWYINLFLIVQIEKSKNLLSAQNAQGAK